MQYRGSTEAGLVKGKTVRVSAILRHTGELGWLKEVLNRVNAMLRLFRESLGLSGRKVGLGIKIQSSGQKYFLFIFFTFLRHIHAYLQLYIFGIPILGGFYYIIFSFLLLLLLHVVCVYMRLG